MVSSGNGLRIIINTVYSFASDWMCFSLFYSIRKMLPESSIILKITKSFNIEKQYFTWLPAFKNSKMKICNELLINEPSFIVIKPISLEIQDKLRGQSLTCDGEVCSEAKGDEFTSFVSYKDGCGKFVVADWINKDECPFSHADHFMSPGISVNEIKVLRTWKQMNVLYPMLARS